MHKNTVLCVIMAFRIDEATKDGRAKALDYLVGKSIDPEDRQKSTWKLDELIEKFGPVVESYPHWHPLVSSSQVDDEGSPVTEPSRRCGYLGLDHTIHLRHAFITCPYAQEERVFESVRKLSHPVAEIKVERIDTKLYHPNAKPILIWCEWGARAQKLGMYRSYGLIPKALAIPLLLEKEIPCWREAQLAETWETMRRYFLGDPGGSKSSMFVDQETGQAMKTIWNSLIYTGMYGPIKV